MRKVAPVQLGSVKGWGTAFLGAAPSLALSSSSSIPISPCKLVFWLLCQESENDFSGRSKKKLCLLYSLFFFGLRICFAYSFRSRLSVTDFLPHLTGQTLNLQNSLKAECIFYPEAKISGLNWNVSLVTPRLNLFLSLILLLNEALHRIPTLTPCNFTKSFFLFFLLLRSEHLGYYISVKYIYAYIFYVIWQFRP